MDNKNLMEFTVTVYEESVKDPEDCLPVDQESVVKLEDECPPASQGSMNKLDDCAPNSEGSVKNPVNHTSDKLQEKKFDPGTKKQRKSRKIHACEQCQNTFSCRSNLTRHVKYMHRQRTEKLKCPGCERTFNRNDTLQRHVKMIHTQQTLIRGNVCFNNSVPPQYECWKCGMKCRYKNSIRRHIFEKHEAGNYECSSCGCTFSRERYLLGHLKRHCGKMCAPKLQNCVVCDQSILKQKIFEHYEDEHGLDFRRESLEFSTPEEFYDWKRSMQLATNSSYTVSRVDRGKRFKVITFKCHRSGPQIIKLTDRKIKMKALGSKKLNAVCPAEIKLRQSLNDSTCFVTFRKTHLGHDLSSKEVDFIYALRSDRVNLVYDRALKEIVKDSEDDELLIDFLSFPINRIPAAEKDLHVRERSYRAHTDDAYDEDKVEEFINRYSDCFIYCKRPNQPADDKFPFLETEDIVLVFVSPSQQMLLHKHGNNVILLDGTYGTKPFPFWLHSMLVLDYDCDGMPGAFAISNRNDILVVKVFLTCVKQKIGTLEPNSLMTGMQELYYDGWKAVMGIPSHRMYCTWHVKKAWERNLKSLIPLERNRDETKKIVNDLLCEADFDVFYERLQNLLGNGDPNCSYFLEYFKETFCDKPQLWAYCFRQCAGVNTNMHVEAFHSTLEHLHGQEGELPNFYVGLLTMVNCVKRKLLDTLTRAVRGKITRKLRTLRRAHSDYVEFAANHEIRIEVDRNEEKWRIQSFREKADASGPDMYIVRRLRKTCPVQEDLDYGTCNWLCKECQVCAHLYSCTCADNAIKNSMCRHIHAVASIFGTNSTISAAFETDSMSIENDFSSTIDDEFELPELAISATADDGSNLRSRKEKLISKLNSVMKVIAEADDEYVLEVIDRILAPVESVETVSQE